VIGFLDSYVEKEVENSIEVVRAWVADMEAREKLAKIFGALFCMCVKLGCSH
jgi:hypothetical protein